MRPFIPAVVIMVLSCTHSVTGLLPQASSNDANYSSYGIISEPLFVIKAISRNILPTAVLTTAQGDANGTTISFSGRVDPQAVPDDGTPTLPVVGFMVSLNTKAFTFHGSLNVWQALIVESLWSSRATENLADPAACRMNYSWVSEGTLLVVANWGLDPSNVTNSALLNNRTITDLTTTPQEFINARQALFASNASSSPVTLLLSNVPIWSLRDPIECSFRFAMSHDDVSLLNLSISTVSLSSRNDSSPVTTLQVVADNGNYWALLPTNWSSTNTTTNVSGSSTIRAENTTRGLLKLETTIDIRVIFAPIEDATALLLSSPAQVRATSVSSLAAGAITLNPFFGVAAAVMPLVFAMDWCGTQYFPPKGVEFVGDADALTTALSSLFVFTEDLAISFNAAMRRSIVGNLVVLGCCVSLAAAVGVAVALLDSTSNVGRGFASRFTSVFSFPAVMAVVLLSPELLGVGAHFLVFGDTLDDWTTVVSAVALIVVAITFVVVCVVHLQAQLSVFAVLWAMVPSQGNSSMFRLCATPPEEHTPEQYLIAAAISSTSPTFDDGDSCCADDSVCWSNSPSLVDNARRWMPFLQASRKPLLFPGVLMCALGCSLLVVLGPSRELMSSSAYTDRLEVMHRCGALQLGAALLWAVALLGFGVSRPLLWGLNGNGTSVSSLITMIVWATMIGLQVSSFAACGLYNITARRRASLLVALTSLRACAALLLLVYATMAGVHLAWTGVLRLKALVTIYNGSVEMLWRSEVRSRALAICATASATKANDAEYAEMTSLGDMMHEDVGDDVDARQFNSDESESSYDGGGLLDKIAAPVTAPKFREFSRSASSYRMNAVSSTAPLTRASLQKQLREGSLEWCRVRAIDTHHIDTLMITTHADSDDWEEEMASHNGSVAKGGDDSIVIDVEDAMLLGGGVHCMRRTAMHPDEIPL